MKDSYLILDVLARKQDPYTLDELCEAINYPHSKKRTVRRVLKLLEEEGKIRFLGGNKNRKYELIRVAVDTSLQEEIIFSRNSLKILESLNLPLYAREPCTYHEDWLMSYIPNKTFYLSAAQRNDLMKSGGYTTDNQPAGTYANKIYDRLLIDLSYNSSRLEGNTYSLLDTQKLLLEGKIAEDKIDADRVMILNHKEAIRFLVKGAERVEVNEETVKTLHYLLSDGLVLPEDSGNVRQSGVKISGSVYFPLDNPARIQKIFSTIIKKAIQIENVFEQSFFLLVHLSYLQAFIDVNKRTARLAANIPLVKKNCIPISFNDIEKEDYQRAIIAIYELNETLPLSNLFIFTYTRTCKEYKVICESVILDVKRMKYRSDRRELIAAMIREKIVKDKIDPYIQKTVNRLIPKEDHEKFISDLKNDLAHLDVIRIGGLGVSRQEFEAWQKLK